MARGEEQGNAKLTAEQVRAIRQDGRTHTAIASDYGISQPQVSKIKTKRQWAHA